MFWTPWPYPQRKPPPHVPVRINLAHPLARGLLSCVLFQEGGGAPYDLVRRRFLTRTAGAVWTVGRAGLAAAGSNSGFVGLLPAISDHWALGTEGSGLSLPTTSCTVAFIRRKTDTAARAASHFGVLAPRLHAHLPYIDAQIYWDFGADAGANRLSVAYPSNTASPQVWTLVAGTRGSAIYFDGTVQATQATGITRATGTDTFTLNRASATGDGDIQEFALFLLASAEWTSDLARLFALKPYGFLQVPNAYGGFGPVDAGEVAAVGGGSQTFHHHHT